MSSPAASAVAVLVFCLTGLVYTDLCIDYRGLVAAYLCDRCVLDSRQLTMPAPRHSVFSARCNIYISRLCHDAGPSVRLSVTEVHWRIVANLSFKFRSHFAAAARHAACSTAARRATCGRIISCHASQC